MSYLWYLRNIPGRAHLTIMQHTCRKLSYIIASLSQKQTYSYLITRIRAPISCCGLRPRVFIIILYFIVRIIGSSDLWETNFYPSCWRQSRAYIWRSKLCLIYLPLNMSWWELLLLVYSRPFGGNHNFLVLSQHRVSFPPCYQKHRLLLPPTIDIEERCFRRRVTKMSEWILIGSLNTSGVAERPFKQCKRC